MLWFSNKREILNAGTVTVFPDLMANYTTQLCLFQTITVIIPDRLMFREVMFLHVTTVYLSEPPDSVRVSCTERPGNSCELSTNHPLLSALY